MIKLNMLNFGHYKGGVDIFTQLLKNELERNFKVDVKLNNENYGMFDIIHNHNPYNPILSSVLTIHSLDFDYRYEKFVYNAVENAIIVNCITKYQKKELYKNYGIRCKKWILNFSDMCYYPKKIVGDNNLIIGYVGRLDKDKGINDLVRLALEFPDKIKVVCVGYNQHNYKEFDNFVIIEHIENREQLSKLIDMFDIAVFPTHKDNCPISIIDCLFRKIPVIVRNLKSLKSTFKDSVFYFEDYNDLKELVFNVYDNITLKKINKSFNYAYKRFNPIEQTYKYYRMYKELLW